MHRSRFRSAAFAVLVIAALELSTAARPAVHTMAAPLHASNVLVVARDVSGAKTMDPGRMYEFAAEDMAANVYETLITFRGRNWSHPSPMLATSWQVSSDAKTYKFFLRQGVRFSNGDP